MPESPLTPEEKEIVNRLAKASADSYEKFIRENQLLDENHRSKIGIANLVPQLREDNGNANNTQGSTTESPGPTTIGANG